jgi:hypothetical protein
MPVQTALFVRVKPGIFNSKLQGFFFYRPTDPKISPRCDYPYNAKKLEAMECYGRKLQLF